MSDRDRARQAACDANKAVAEPKVDIRDRGYWRHRTTGGAYRVQGVVDGSGVLHGHRIVVYHDTVTPSRVFARALLEWHEKMEYMKHG